MSRILLNRLIDLIVGEADECFQKIGSKFASRGADKFKDADILIAGIDGISKQTQIVSGSNFVCRGHSPSSNNLRAVVASVYKHIGARKSERGKQRNVTPSSPFCEKIKGSTGKDMQDSGSRCDILKGYNGSLKLYVSYI